MNIIKLLFVGALLALGNLAWAEDAAEVRTVSVEAKAGIDYFLQGSKDGIEWHTLAGPIAGIDGLLDLKIPEEADYARYHLVEVADTNVIAEEKILNDEEMAEKVFPDWFYGLSHGNYFNVGILLYHGTNLVAPKFIVPVAWLSTIVNTLSIGAAYTEGFHADAPHVVDAHKDAYGHTEHWMAATSSSLWDADWMNGYTDLSGWMAVFFFNALELASGSLGFSAAEQVGMWGGLFGDFIMSSYDFSNKAIRYSEVTISEDPEGQALYQRAWDGAWVYALKCASGILPFGVQYFAYKAGGADGYWQGASDTVKWTGRLLSALGAAGYIYVGLGDVDHEQPAVVKGTDA